MGVGLSVTDRRDGGMDLSTTQRYIRLSPAAVEAAIRPLDSAPPGPCRGDIVATAQGQIRKSLIEK